MENMQDSIKKNLSRFGIESSKRDSEKCPECNYGRRITIVVNGEEKTYCRYCENQKLAKQLNVSLSEKEKKRNALLDKIKYFDRVPNDLRHVKLNDYIAETIEQKRAKEIAKNFIWYFDKEKSLVLSGDPGVGKSHIAVSIKKALSDKYTTLFLKTTELLTFVRQTYDGAMHTEQEVFEVCRDVDLLVLDDLGAEYVKQNDNESWASDILYKVLDSRLGKSTIVTTNYTESGLKEKFGLNGERIVSRMFDKAKAIRIIGKDRRKENNVRM